MPRFFFHLSDGVHGTDVEGTELDDLAAARENAVRFLAQSLIDQGSAFWTDPDWALVVTDESDLALFTVRVVGTDAPAALVLAPAPPNSI